MSAPSAPSATLSTNEQEDLSKDVKGMMDQMEKMKKVEEVEGDNPKETPESDEDLKKKYLAMQKKWDNKIKGLKDDYKGGDIMKAWDMFMSIVYERMNTPKEQQPTLWKRVATANKMDFIKDNLLGKSEKYGSGLKEKRAADEEKAAPETPRTPGPSRRA